YRNGRAVLTNTIATTDAPAAVALQPDRPVIVSDGSDVSIITVSIVDAQGRVVPTANNTVAFSVKNGTILGTGNGDPASHEPDQPSTNGCQRSVFNGLAQLIVQSTTKAGPILITATSPGLAPAT